MSLVGEENHQVLERYLHVAERRKSAHQTTIEATVGICAVGFALTAGCLVVGAATGGAALPLVVSTLGPYAISTGLGTGITSFLSAVGMKVAKTQKDKKLFKKIKKVMREMLDQQIKTLDGATQELFEKLLKNEQTIDEKQVSELLLKFGIQLNAEPNEKFTQFLERANKQAKEQYLQTSERLASGNLKALMIFISYLQASYKAKNANKFDVATEIENIIKNFEQDCQGATNDSRRRRSSVPTPSRPFEKPDGLQRSESV